MNDYKNIEGANFLGPDFLANPEYMEEFKDIYADLQEDLAFTFSIHWLISCNFFGAVAPSEVTKYMYYNSLDFLSDASIRYIAICGEINKNCSSLRKDYSAFTKSFIDRLSKEGIETGGEVLININGNDIGRLIKKMESCNQLLITFFYNPKSNESNTEKSHTIAMSKYSDKFYIFDPNIGVYEVANSAFLGRFIKGLFNFYVSHREINCYSCVNILPTGNAEEQGGI